MLPTRAPNQGGLATGHPRRFHSDGDQPCIQTHARITLGHHDSRQDHAPGWSRSIQPITEVGRMTSPWTPLSEEDLRQEIESGIAQMTPEQRLLWSRICITPEKWGLHPEGDSGGGFWVVAIIGKSVIWYNDIEEGFNRSTYSSYGAIGECWCNQDELQWTVGHLLDLIRTGEDRDYNLGPSEPIV